MSRCAHCGREIPAADRRLRLDGTVAWTAAAPGRATKDETAIEGTAEFCSIRCLGTLVGVRLQERGLMPPKKP